MFNSDIPFAILLLYLHRMFQYKNIIKYSVTQYTKWALLIAINGVIPPNGLVNG